MPAPNQTCAFCRGPAECATKAGAGRERFACCRRCAKETLAPLLADILGPAEAAAVMNNLATVGTLPGGTPARVSGLGAKLERLISGGELSRADVLAGRSVSAGEATLARRVSAARARARRENRPLTREEAQLSLALTAERLRRAPREMLRPADGGRRQMAQAAVAAVKRYGLDRSRG